MSRTLKWILGILAVLVVLAVVAGGAWAWQHRSQLMAYGRPYAAQPSAPGAPNAPNGQNVPNGPFGPRGLYGNGRNPMNAWGFRGPMMGGRHMGRGMPFGMGFFFLGGLLRLIIPLGLLALLAFVFYQLGRRSAVVHTSAPAPRQEPGPSETTADRDLPKTS